jgi:hypothetical protein
MGMADRDRQRIGSIGGAIDETRQDSAHHQLHLRLFGMAGPDHCLLD